MELRNGGTLPKDSALFRRMLQASPADDAIQWAPDSALTRLARAEDVLAFPLNAQTLRERGLPAPIVVGAKGRDAIGIRVPPSSWTPDDIARLLGPDAEVTALAVRDQTEVTMTLGEWASYFKGEVVDAARGPAHRRGRAADLIRPKAPRAAVFREHLSSSAAGRADAAGRPKAPKEALLNLVSLEVSSTPLAAELRAPQVVREVDWIDTAWPRALRVEGELAAEKQALGIGGSNKGRFSTHYPRIQHYCLMSPTHSYTDWHVDFGGTSVWYHVLRGRKVFFLAPPTEQVLEAFRRWSTGETGEATFFPSLLPRGTVLRFEVRAGETLLLPSGWPHAVYTPADALVFGGNFFFAAAAHTQVRISELEEAARIPQRLRCPFFFELHWYGAMRFAEQARAALRRRRDGAEPAPFVAGARELESMSLLLDKLQSWALCKHRSPCVPDCVAQPAVFLAQLRRLLSLASAAARERGARKKRRGFPSGARGKRRRADASAAERRAAALLCPLAPTGVLPVPHRHLERAEAAAALSAALRRRGMGGPVCRAALDDAQLGFPGAAPARGRAGAAPCFFCAAPLAPGCAGGLSAAEMVERGEAVACAYCPLLYHASCLEDAVAEAARREPRPAGAEALLGAASSAPAPGERPAPRWLPGLPRCEESAWACPECQICVFDKCAFALRSGDALPSFFPHVVDAAAPEPGRRRRRRRRSRRSRTTRRWT